MYRFLVYNYYQDILNSSKWSLTNGQFHCACLSFRSLQKPQGKPFHTSQQSNAHYMAALKHLLSKKLKRNKRKKYVEVLNGSNGVITNETATIDTLRGSKLTAFTTQLSYNANRSTVGNDAIRHYDPLVVLPMERESPIDVVDSLFNNRNSFNSPPLLNLKPLPKSITVPEIIKSYKNATGKLEQSVDIFVKSDGKITAHSRNPSLSNMRYFNRLVIKDNARVSDNFEGLSNCETEDCDEFMENTEQPNVLISPLQKPKVKKTSYNVGLKKKAREIIAKQKLKDLEKLGRTESLNSNFLSYVDVCINTGMVSTAFSAIKMYRRKIAVQKKDWYPKLSDIAVYNLILRTYAQQENLMKIQELLEFIRTDNVKPDSQTFAAILDCLARKKVKNCHINNCLSEMNQQGISLNDLFLKTHMSQESYSNILSAIREVKPNFTPEPLNINLNYNCPLLNNLNSSAKTKLSSPKPEYCTLEDLKTHYDEQLSVELNSYVKVKSIAKQTESPETIKVFRNKLDQVMSQCEEMISHAFDRDLQLLELQSRNKSYFYFSIYPYLKTLPKEDFVDIILREIRYLAEGSETYSPCTRQLYRELGKKICVRYQMKQKEKNGTLKKLNNIYSSYCDWYANPTGEAMNTRQQWQILLRDHYQSTVLDAHNIIWKNHILVGVGRFLYNIIIRDVKFDANIMRNTLSDKQNILPAFYTLFRCKSHSSKEEIKPHPVLSRLFRQSAPDDLIFNVQEIPMVCPPIPWTCIFSGGNLITKNDIIRLPYQALAQWKVLEKTPVENLYPAFDSLNQLGAVPWKINEEVLDVLLEVFRSGGSSKLDVPLPASSCPSAEPLTANMTAQEKFQNFKQRMALRRRKAEMYSLWCDALYKLSLANQFRKRIFWLPHNMDFRGRVYPVAPHLNHLGSDMSRSLLVFAKGKPLGSKGLDWLKIHVINLTGTHKRKSMAERLSYANEILDRILDSADRPLTGGLWWTESEEPWQTLAACVEVRNALASGDPETFVSHFPVHQDGSCNGLQHYAALGRDKAGGRSVNLTPTAIPQDVYSSVAALVEKQRALDAENGIEIAKILEGFIFRKVIKQTVMTTVYGVTRFGARLQIARQLKDLDEFPADRVWQASMYLVVKTFESLQEMFTSTKEIQDWFTDCARLISQVCGENVEWVTPLGLPIVQPYTRPQTTFLKIDNLKFIGVEAGAYADAFERPNVMKQKNAFAPNFVHSLDSSHMMLTSLICERSNVTFVSVHDCYWTHACTVQEMNRICRDQFVALHSQPILANLSAYFAKRYSYHETSITNDGSVTDEAKKNLNRTLKAVPSTGSLNLKSILKSEYFFS